MPDPSRSDMKLYERAARNGWDVPRDSASRWSGCWARSWATPGRRRDRTAAARALLQASRVELDGDPAGGFAAVGDLERRVAGAGGGRRRCRTGRS